MKAITKTGKEVVLTGTQFSIPAMGIQGKYIPRWTEERKTKTPGLATKAVCQGQHVFLALIRTAELDTYLAEQARIIDNRNRENAENEKHTFKLNIGICFHSDYGCHYVEFDDRRSEDEILSLILQKGREELGCCHKPATHENSIMEAYNEWKKEKKIKEAQHAAQVEKKRLAIEEAKKTGKNVLWRSYSMDCNDPREECSVDMVYMYITPKGTLKTERNHTY